MPPPRHISYSLLLPTTGLQVNTSSKPSEAYQYYRSPCHHLAIYLIFYSYLPQVYRSTRRQHPQKHTITSGHHVPTSPYISFSTTTYYRSTGQHVVKTPRIIPLLQVTMSPHCHISFSTTTYYRSTGQHVVKALRIILYYRSTCPHIAIYLILYYYLLQVYRSTRRQNPQNQTITTGHHVTTSPYIFISSTTDYRSTRRQNPQKHTSTTGHHVTTSPYILFSTPTYYRSTGLHVVKTLRSIPLLQVTMSPPRHISRSLLPPTTGLQVNTSSKPPESYHYYRSPCPHIAISHSLLLLLQVHRSTCSQSPKNHTLLQVNMSPHRHISHSLLLPTTSLQVNTSSKPSESILYYRSPCHHLAIYLYLFYYRLQVNTLSKPPESYQYLFIVPL